MCGVKRRVSNLLGAVSLMLCVAMATSAAISHCRGAILGRIGNYCSFYVRSEYGKLSFSIHGTDAGQKPRWLLESWPLEAAWTSPNLAGWWKHAGFDYGIGGTAGGNTIRQLVIPYWLVVVLFLTVAVWRMQTRRRHAVGRCRHCGYDLRATPERCPECGTPATPGDVG